ncbi:MAG: response regulator [Planctomycetia bacterium]|jgi:putative two-component system response regulator
MSQTPEGINQEVAEEARKKRVLIVDDDLAVCRLLLHVLGKEYEVESANDGIEALEKVQTFKPEVVLLDILLPCIDGYETCRRLRVLPDAPQDVHIIFASVKSSKEEQMHAYQCGGDDYVVKPFDIPELLSRIKLHFRLRDALATVEEVQTEIEEQKSEAKRRVEIQQRQLIETQSIAMYTLAKIAECRDTDTGDHLFRMRDYAQVIAKQLQNDSEYSYLVDQQFLEDLYRSSPLHDIGKVAVPDAILLKPGRLTPEEFKRIQEHSVVGGQILDEAVWQSNGGQFLAMAASIARFHHECFDGNGYPSGLKGIHIPLSARIVAVADVYDALTSERPYKSAYPPSKAYKMIIEKSGTQFDPVIVKAFQDAFDDILRTQQKYQETLSDEEVRGEMLVAATGEM